jgi:hypothetical protein
MKAKRWSTEEKPGKGWMGRPTRLRLTKDIPRRPAPQSIVRRTPA